MKVRLKEVLDAVRVDTKANPLPACILSDKFHPKAPFYTEVSGGVYENVVDGDWILTSPTTELHRKVVKSEDFDKNYEVVGG